MNTPTPKTDQQRANLRMGLILASVAVAFFVGFMAKMVFLGH